MSNTIKIINANGNVLRYWKRVTVQYYDPKAQTIHFTDEKHNQVRLILGNNVSYIEEYEE